MKSNAIVRIVLLSLAILVLLGILLAGLGLQFGWIALRNSPLFNWGWGGISGGTVSQSGSVSAADVRDLKIEWAAGSVTIRPEDTDEITFFETESDRPMVWKQTGDKLAIQFCEHWSWGISGFRKDLVITVPLDWECRDLEIDAASAQVDVRGLCFRNVEIDTASGVCTFENCQVDKLDLDTASGDVYFSGTLNVLDCDAASASCEIALSNVPSRINMDGMSGDLDLTLPDDAGFSAGVDAMSGRFTSDFPTTVSNGRYVCGNEACRIDVDGMSGDVYIRRHGTSNSTVCTIPGCTDQSHNHGVDCNVPGCTDQSHNHSTVCTIPGCTDQSHNHGVDCNVPGCTDRSHNHSTVCTIPGCTDQSHNHGVDCNVPGCTDRSHNHSTVCTIPGCTDRDHDHGGLHHN